MRSIFLKVSVYMVVTIFVTIVVAIIQQRLFQQFKIETLNFDKLEGAPIILPQLAPAISFIIIILLVESLRTSINFNFNSIIAMKSLFAIVIPFFLASIIFFISKVLGMEPRFTSASMATFAFALLTILIGALGEEIGWRGFLQPLLEKKYSALLSSVLVGLLWGLWHVGHFKNGIMYMFAFLVFTVSASIIIAWLYRDTGFSIIIVTLFHTSFNFCNFIMFKDSLVNYKFMLITAAVWLIPAILIILLTGKELIRS